MAIALAILILLSFLAVCFGIGYVIFRWPGWVAWITLTVLIMDAMFWGMFWTWVVYTGVGPL